eukprot:jgi/Mesvir1/6902/Mv09062-RA.1
MSLASCCVHAFGQKICCPLISHDPHATCAHLHRLLAPAPPRPRPTDAMPLRRHAPPRPCPTDAMPAVPVCPFPGGAERLVVDAATELAHLGHTVAVYTSHHSRDHCFEETVDGTFPVVVYGDWLPRHLFGRLHVLFAYVRALYLALMFMLFEGPWDVLVVDQVSAAVPLLRLKRGWQILFYCHFPDQLLVQRSSLLRSLYRAPFNLWEEMSTGCAHRILVNSIYTATVFAATFARLTAWGAKPEVLYPAVRLTSRQPAPPPALAPTPSPSGGGDKLAKSQAQATKSRASSNGGAGADGAMVAGVPGLTKDSTLFVSINRFERKKNIQLALLSFARVLEHQQPSSGSPGDAGSSPSSNAASPKAANDGKGKPASSTASHRRQKKKASVGGWAEPAPTGGVTKLATEVDPSRLRLVIAGGYDPRVLENVEYLEELRALAATVGVAQQVVFLTSVSSQQRDTLIEAAQAIVYTPKDEHFGIVPLEAMAAGRAVIACNSGGPTETVIHGETGFLCDATPAAFADAMARVLAKDKATTMGRAARRLVEAKFSRRQFGERLDAIIRDMVSC